ncbi:MAG: hypothetical protein ACI87E_004849 [Mariniblastus sp.]|jgi:hypothetical protein
MRRYLVSRIQVSRIQISRIQIFGFYLMFLICSLLSACVEAQTDALTADGTQATHRLKSDSSIRFATFNVSFNRPRLGQLKDEFSAGESLAPRQIAEVIQRVRPDVLLLNEFDYDAEGKGIAGFATNYLSVSQNGESPIAYEYVYFAPVNTGVDSALDLNSDGVLGTANDAFGYGAFAGQYGMVVLSKFEIDKSSVRTFQKFLWADMPDGLWPVDPETKLPYYNDTIKQSFRLSSKSHWDVPIKIGDETIHFLTAHPTPPVFDGDEDRNGRRNHDEIRLFSDYISPDKSGYLYDDQGNKGGLSEGVNFVIAGDMNADEFDGDSTMGAARLLTKHPLINHQLVPSSDGGVHYSKSQGRANLKHQGPAESDTGDFNDFKVGNLHLDYCLPSKTLTIKASGVFWPRPGEPGADLVLATDHRMVWVDVGKRVEPKAGK